MTEMSPSLTSRPWNQKKFVVINLILFSESDLSLVFTKLFLVIKNRVDGIETGESYLLDRVSPSLACQ